MVQVSLSLPEAFKRAVAAYQRGQFGEAERLARSILAAKADYFDALHLIAVLESQRRRYAKALASYDRALAVRPDYPEALYNRGNVLKELKRFDEALASYDRALVVRPDYPDALYNRGNTLHELKRLEEALASYEKALAVKRDHRYAFGGLIDCTLRNCDWMRMAKLDRELGAHITERKSIIRPFTLLGRSSDASLQLQCARSFIEDKIPILPQPLWNGTLYQHEKIRIAYLSADFRQHATAYLMAELFELHDRKDFEVVGVSFGVDNMSDMRARLVKSFDQFHDVRLKADREVASLLHELEIDIAVDLKGYTQNSRPEILAYRPAPVQVNYLGYPGTMGADFIDYMIADRIVLPFDQQAFYAEKIVHLPDCYQVNDSTKQISAHTPLRREAGLPDDGFVFCCFNNAYKITAPVFDVWMRLLQAVDGSVLWLLADNARAESNLREGAAARGVDPWERCQRGEPATSFAVTAV